MTWNDALEPMRDASGNDRLIMTRVLRDSTGAFISNNLVITFAYLIMGPELPPRR